MYLLKRSEPFERSLKKLLKRNPYKVAIIKQLKDITAELVNEPTFSNSLINANEEGISATILNSPDLAFWKIRFVAGRGARGKIRLMYLINDVEKIVILVYIYDHKQFAKRPADDFLKQVIRQVVQDA